MNGLDDYGGWPGVLATLAAGRDIGAGEARAALGAILAGEATDAQVAAFIVALRLKGPAVGELLGLVGAMRDAATPLDVPAEAIDIVGTGGTAGRKAHALNVSTMACFVAAGAGATVCKHGSVKASSTSGAFNLLEAIGVPITAPPRHVEEMVRSVGLGFAFAKTFHPAMRHVAGVRSEVGISTVFNLLGPLSHPGHVQRQVLGVLEPSLAPTMAAVLQATGSVRSLVVHGDGRFDEFTTTGPNLVVELNEGQVTECRVDAADVGLPPARPDELRGGDPVANARILSGVLAGEPGPKRDMVVLNAAAGLVVAGIADDLATGVEAAAAAIDDGRAAKKFDEVTRRRRPADRDGTIRPNNQAGRGRRRAGHHADVSVDAAALAAVGRQAGLCAVGFCRAEPFTRTAEVLRHRKEAGLHGGMQFTYRNPARSSDPARLVPGAAALVVGALEFSAESDDRPDDGSPYARVAAYARADYYTPLRAALETVAGALREAGHRAVVSADENGLVDRAAAHRAGIGWWGKNSNILVPGSGSLVVLGAVVTDAPVAGPDPAVVADGCGSCRQCLDGCPTGAIVAPGTVDARRCLAWLVQADGVFDPRHRVALGDRIYGCDDCSEVCPPNRARGRADRPRSAEEFAKGSAMPWPERPASAADRSGSETRVRLTERAGSQDHQSEPDQRARQGTGPGPWVSVLDLLDSSDSELLATLGRWYIPRRQPRYLRRNALVVLANEGEGSDPRVRAAVDRALRDPDPLIQAHAVWCARRLGLGLDALSDRDDPLVRAELERPVPPRAAA